MKGRQRIFTWFLFFTFLFMQSSQYFVQLENCMEWEWKREKQKILQKVSAEEQPVMVQRTPTNSVQVGKNEKRTSLNIKILAGKTCGKEKLYWKSFFVGKDEHIYVPREVRLRTEYLRAPPGMPFAH